MADARDALRCLDCGYYLDSPNHELGCRTGGHDRKCPSQTGKPLWCACALIADIRSEEQGQGGAIARGMVAQARRDTRTAIREAVNEKWLNYAVLSDASSHERAAALQEIIEMLDGMGHD